MATSKKMYVPTRPGPIGSVKLDQYHVPTEDKDGAFLAVFLVGQMFEKRTFPILGGGLPYSSGQWTETKTGTGAAIAEATTAGGGALFTTGSTSTFYSGVQSKWGVTPTAGKRYSFQAIVQVSHATQVGFNIGFANVQAGPTGTEYTDFVGFRKAPTSASVYGTVIGNSGSVTQTSSALKTAVAATEYRISCWFYLGATAADCYGSFVVDGTETTMSSTLITELFKLLTTAPTDFSATVFFTGTSGNNATGTVTSFLAEVDK